jgi:hypothetical protein
VVVCGGAVNPRQGDGIADPPPLPYLILRGGM